MKGRTICCCAVAWLLATLPTLAGVFGRPVPPASQPASSGTAATPAVSLETVRKGFEQTLRTAQAAERANTLAGNIQAMAQYRKAQELLLKWPELRVNADTSARMTERVTQLQAKIKEQSAQQVAARKAAAAERRARAIAIARRGAATSGQYYGGGGGFSGGGGARSGSGGGGAACPPGAARSGSA